jgi:DNA ligase D-like protein (predicted 3'-phosphoesterase)
MEGVLKSWAIPREPPLTPGTKRLAIQVEDHAIEYGSFEGTIPEGEYGAGKVTIWDRGEYTLLEKTPKAMKMDLHGKKLTGNYALVFFKEERRQRQWLLFKVKKEKGKAASS